MREINKCIWTPNYLSKPLRTRLLGQSGRLLEKRKVLHAKPLAYPVARSTRAFVCVTQRDDLTVPAQAYTNEHSCREQAASRGPAGERRRRGTSATCWRARRTAGNSSASSTLGGDYARLHWREPFKQSVHVEYASPPHVRRFKSPARNVFIVEVRHPAP